MVKNWRVFLQAYTRPCSSTGIELRMITFWFAPMTGTRIQPMICARHHRTGLLEKASTKFSVPSATSMDR